MIIPHYLQDVWTRGGLICANPPEVLMQRARAGGAIGAAFLCSLENLKNACDRFNDHGHEIHAEHRVVVLRDVAIATAFFQITNVLSAEESACAEALIRVALPGATVCDAWNYRATLGHSLETVGRCLAAIAKLESFHFAGEFLDTHAFLRFSETLDQAKCLINRLESDAPGFEDERSVVCHILDMLQRIDVVAHDLSEGNPSESASASLARLLEVARLEATPHDIEKPRFRQLDGRTCAARTRIPGGFFVARLRGFVRRELLRGNGL